MKTIIIIRRRRMRIRIRIRIRKRKIIIRRRIIIIRRNSLAPRPAAPPADPLPPVVLPGHQLDAQLGAEARRVPGWLVGWCHIFKNEVEVPRKSL